MKRKLICLLLAFVMLLSCLLTGCSSNEETTEEGGEEEQTVDNSAKTITLWLIEEEGMTEQAKKLVSEAFTEITKSSFKTNVVLQYCSADTYYEKLEQAILDSQEREIRLEECQNAFNAFKNADENKDKDIVKLTEEFYDLHPEYAEFRDDADALEDEEDETGKKEDETETNELGIIETKYPKPDKDQVDIFYLSGYDKYVEYIDKGWLTPLNEELNSSAKKLNAYISVSLLNGVQIDGSVYAIPNNVPIGEYTYMMVDKEYFDTNINKIDNVSSVVDISRFLHDIKNMNKKNGVTADDEGYVVPLHSTFEECMKMLAWYWDLSYTDISVYETYYDEETGREYVLYGQYDIEVEVLDENGETKLDDDGNIVVEYVHQYAPLVEYGKTYKVNSEGQYLDKDGNVLNYTYALDCEYEEDDDGNINYDKPTNWKAWWMDIDYEGPFDNLEAQAVANDDEGKDMALSELKGMYLVDENGDPVTKENDKRVIVEDEESVKLDAYGNILPSYFYTYDKSSDFSIVGTMFDDPSVRDRGSVNLGFNSLFADESYRELYLTMKSYEYEGYFGEPKEGQTAAVFFQKGDARIKMENEKNGYYKDPETGKEYYAVVAEYPEATTEELYGNMFAVYAESPNLSRAMQVITRINTDAKLRNLLQYGIVDQHYELNKDGTVKLLTSDEEDYGTYRMDVYKTGNSFIAYPPEELGANVWEYAKVQNGDSLVAPLLGFDFNDACADESYPIDIELLDYIKRENEKALEIINSCLTIEDLSKKLEEDLAVEYKVNKDNPELSKTVNTAYEPEGDIVNIKKENVIFSNSPNTIYYRWLELYGYKA